MNRIYLRLGSDRPSQIRQVLQIWLPFQGGLLFARVRIRMGHTTRTDRRLGVRIGLPRGEVARGHRLES